MSRSPRFVSLVLLPLTMALALTSLSACAISTDDDELSSDDQDVLGGTLSGDRSVLALRASGSLAEMECTAVLVAPDAVVTAAHCVHSRWVGSSVKVSVTGKDRVGSTGWIKAYAPIIHPEFDAQHVNAGHDIAVVILRSNYTGAPPAWLTAWTLPDAWSDEAARTLEPTTLRVVGYGTTTDNPTAATGRRRERMVPLTDLTDEYLVAGNGGDGQQCHGDSGGPTFLGYYGRWSVVSIASHVYGDCQTGNWGTRIDANYDFLLSALGSRIPAQLLPPPSTFPGTPEL